MGVPGLVAKPTVFVIPKSIGGLTVTVSVSVLFDVIDEFDTFSPPPATLAVFWILPVAVAVGLTVKVI